MTKEQINRLAQLITDTAETAANIELQALAGGKADYVMSGAGQRPDAGRSAL